MRRAVLLFAHGARDPRWAEPFEQIAARMRAAEPGLPVALAFLEMMAPDLHGAIGALASAGADTIDVVPVFLGTGGHLRNDLPPLVAAARSAHPALAIRLHAAIGEDPGVLDAMALAALAAARRGE